MASGTLGADELPKERHKWSEIRKVYTRKLHRKPKTNINNNSNSSTVTLAAPNNQPDVRIVAECNDRTPPVGTKNGVVEANDGADVETSDRADVEKSDEAGVEKNHGVVVEASDICDVEKSDVADVKRNDKVNVVTSNGTIVENDQDGSHVGDARTSSVNTEEIAIEEEPERNSPQLKQPLEEADSLRPQQNSPRVETVFEDSSSLKRVEAAPLPNGRVPNGVVREERPLVSQVDDRLNIRLSAAKSKGQVRDLKRKLEDELDQVRKMSRKLEAKEDQLNDASYGMDSSVSGLPEFPSSGQLPEVPFVSQLPEVPVVDRSEEPFLIKRMRFPINGSIENDVGMRVNQGFSPVGFNKSRPFRQLSVSLMENNYGVGDTVEKEKRTPKANRFYGSSDFILGKEKFTPAESNRKLKSGGGRKKHSDGDFDFSYGIEKKIFKKCSDLLEKLRKHKYAWVFNQPVDVKSLGLHDYFDIIKHPMDLGTVKIRLANNWYKTPREFAEDVRLTFRNAMTYNPEWQDVHIMARDMLKSFEDKWRAIEADYERKLRFEMLRDFGTPTPTSRKTYAPPHAPLHIPPPPVLQPPPYQDLRHLNRSQSMPVRREVTIKPARMPAQKKPKAKDPNKREMTFDEKQKLSTNLQNLPSEKLDAIVHIIKKRSSSLSQHDDEIEVDIDNVDTETLWELDRFVINYKKSLSKHKRRAEIAAARAAQPAQLAIPAPASAEAPREHTADGGNVAPSSHVQQERQSGNGSGSSSSSSSSSDSGSSSSDSDSDSSSSSDSDEES